MFTLCTKELLNYEMSTTSLMSDENLPSGFRVNIPSLAPASHGLSNLKNHCKEK